MEGIEEKNASSSAEKIEEEEEEEEVLRMEAEKRESDPPEAVWESFVRSEKD